MSETSNQLREYLAANERLAAVYSATLSEDTPWEPVSLGVTDRRLLCVSDDGTFVNFDHDAICSVRSHLRSTSTYRGNDHRLLMGIGGLVVVLGFAGVVSLASSMLVPLLLPALVGGLASAEYQRRAAGIDWPDVGNLVGRFRRDGVRAPSGRAAVDFGENSQVLLLVNGLIAAVSLVGIAAVSASLLVVFLSLSTVGGLAVIDYAHRHRSDFDGFERVRRREREVQILTNDGDTVRIRCDPSDEIGRELSRLAFVDRDDTVPAVTPRTKSSAEAGSPEG